MIQHKKLFSFTVICLAILAGFSVMAQNSTKGYNGSKGEMTRKQDTEETFSLAANLKAGFESWEAQLDFIRQGGYKGVLDSSDLSLVSFTAVEAGEYPTLEEFKEMPVSIIGRSDKNGVPVIQKIREKWRGAKFYRAIKADIVNYYDSLEVDLGLHLVRLEWKYQDSTFHSYCVVSETLDTFIYDDILSNIFIVTKSRGGDVALQPSDVMPGDDYIFGEALAIKSPIGSTLAQTSTTIKVRRKKDGDKLSIKDYSYDNKFNSMPFWEATGKSNIVSFKEGKDGHVNFAYELGVKYGSAILDGQEGSGAKWGTLSSINVLPSTSTVQ
ncbi:hypothetical protein [Sphingobacterium sp. FBM7-1]|uniref:hypothetical protein n=1 Tax=Sphingobacterium sp. FBM7-1 TaxID=2886688 RepID=UPI001D1273D9|nr:hypothetical protein [Sphingobacterium sp. FBM7-1]MCC2600306.1 hypothetical protein [Sphingobacterium sp. FBM7-1]